MEEAEFNFSEINMNTGLLIGDNDAPVKVVEFINLRCPHCEEWWDKADDLLMSYVDDKKVQRIIKHYNKDKASLLNGNIIHDYINYDDSEHTKKVIDELFDRQEEWGRLPQSEVGTWAKEKTGLKKEANEEITKQFLNEAKEVNVQSIPTIFIGETVFDEDIPKEKLIDLVEKAANQ